MQIRFIKLREQNIDFMIVLVKDHVANNQFEAGPLVQDLSLRFGLPVVLCGDSSGRYYGRTDIVNFLVNNLHPARIKWSVLNVAA